MHACYVWPGLKREEKKSPSLTIRKFCRSCPEYVCDLGAGKIDDFKEVTKAAKLNPTAMR